VSKQLQFLGYRLTKPTMNMTLSLIESTVGRFGLHKRFFKTEETFWDAIHFVVGMRRKDGEGFTLAIERVCRIWVRTSQEAKAQIINGIKREELYAAAKVNPADFAILGDTVMLPRSEKVRTPRAKRVKIRKGPAASLTTPVRLWELHGGYAPKHTEKEEFYKSWDWRTLRMQVIKEFGRICQCCGAAPGQFDAAGKPVRIVVDHIKPISKYWALRLTKSNLQILCDECNMGKGNWDETDFRPSEEPDEWGEGPTDDIVLDVLASMAPANGAAA
jgi:hypothetical protein